MKLGCANKESLGKTKGPGAHHRRKSGHARKLKGGALEAKGVAGAEAGGGEEEDGEGGGRCAEIGGGGGNSKSYLVGCGDFVRIISVKYKKTNISPRSIPRSFRTCRQEE